MTDVMNYINYAAAQNDTILCILSISFLFVSGIITAKSGSKGGFRDRRSRVTERWAASPKVKFVIPRAAPSALVQRVERQLGSVSDNSVRNARLQLARAGYRGRRWLVAFRAAKVCCPMLGVLIGLLVILCFPEKIVELYIRFGIMTTFLVGGFYMPDLIVGNLGRRRLCAIRKSLPDGLDLLVICAEAGLSLDASLVRVGGELGRSAKELAEELSCVSSELGFLPDRKQAFSNLVARCDLAELRTVANTLIQTERYGTPLTQALRVLSSDFREQRMLRAEERAARLPAIMTVPMIVFILPALFVVLIGPAILDVYDHLVK